MKVKKWKDEKKKKKKGQSWTNVDIFDVEGVKYQSNYHLGYDEVIHHCGSEKNLLLHPVAINDCLFSDYN